jgi:hypothetical protein
MAAAPPESHTPALRDLQRRFLRDLADGDDPAADRFAALFEEPPCGRFENRREVYRSGYVARIAEALENDYRALRRIVGEGPFAAMTGRYVAAAPPASFDLGAVGDRLPGFLADDLLTEQLPFLPDLARLELAQAKAFVARDSAPLDWDRLARRGAEAAADTVIRSRPGTAVIRSTWPLEAIQACRDLPDEQVSIPLQGRPVTLLVYRRAIDDDEARLIAIFASGATLSTLPEALQCGDDPILLNRFLDLLRRLVGEGIFTTPQRKESP